MLENKSAASCVVVLGIDKFLYDEAQLLDESRYEEWLELLADDIRYRAPQIEFTHRADSRLDAIGAHHFDEDKTSIRNRIAWLTSGVNNSEIPMSLKTRLVSNIRLIEATQPDQVGVESKFILWQGRWDGTTALFAGRREDMLRRDAKGWLLVRRTIYLSTPILPRSLTVFL